jgi:hypothetical protein
MLGVRSGARTTWAALASWSRFRPSSALASAVGLYRLETGIAFLVLTPTSGPMMYEMFEALSMEKPDPKLAYVYADACAVSKRKLLEALHA